LLLTQLLPPNRHFCHYFADIGRDFKSFFHPTPKTVLFVSDHSRSLSIAGAISIIIELVKLCDNVEKSIITNITAQLSLLHSIDNRQSWSNDFVSSIIIASH
jgi:hypothetical protein